MQLLPCVLGLHLQAAGSSKQAGPGPGYAASMAESHWPEELLQVILENTGCFSEAVSSDRASMSGRCRVQRVDAAVLYVCLGLRDCVDFPYKHHKQAPLLCQPTHDRIWQTWARMACRAWSTCGIGAARSRTVTQSHVSAGTREHQMCWRWVRFGMRVLSNPPFIVSACLSTLRGAEC